MVALSPAFLALAVFCSSAIAAPWPLHSRQHTHQLRTLPSGLRVKSYHPVATYKTFGDGIDAPQPSGDGFASASFKDSAMSFINQQLGSEQVQYFSGFEGDKSKHYYVNQHFNGIPVANAVAHSSLNAAGKVTAFSSSFVTPQNKPISTPKITKTAAIATVKSQGGATPTSKAIGLEYYTEDNGDVTLSYVIEAHTNADGNLVEFFVDAVSNKIVGLINYTHKLTYHVLPITKQSPEEGLETLVDPEDKNASPNGWVANGQTSGNNVEVRKSNQVGTESSAAGFEFDFDPKSSPNATSQVNLARANAFYIVNTIHDVTYLYGFTEAAFNFQNDNFGKGGKGNDRVTVSVQDKSGTDNADFTTPADGSSGSMRMFLWDITKPMRDGALENDIVSHEMTHGVTNRLTGGGTGRCLGTEEAGGMGEGWSDSISFWMEQTAADVQPFTMGAFVTNNPAGIRSHPYSADASVNPYTYATVATKNEVHDIGEVWANMLITVYTALVKQSGFDINAHKDASLTTGNAIWMHLFIDSLSLQPCNPTFVTARDAWIQADKNRYQGKNSCTVWQAFASKGLGSGATDDKVDNSDVPAECNGTGSGPTDPAPTDPEPTDPEPTDPQPTDPEPTDPEPTDPEPTDPEPTDPEPTDPEPTDPFPTDPEPTDPEPTDPVPTGTPGGGDGDGGDDDTCPLLGIPKSQLPPWWPFDWC